MRSMVNWELLIRKKYSSKFLSKENHDSNPNQSPSLKIKTTIEM
jgi:hypothetical protein